MHLTSLPKYARSANRLREIFTILSKYGLADWVSRLHVGFVRGLFKGPEGQGLTELTHERRIRLTLTELGTTFIKFGQMLSTRGDLIGPELAAELTALQADAPADPPRIVRSTIESELGAPLEELFAEFEERPVASASIGQAHRARLKDGRRVIVKVQHPGIEARIRNDLNILLGLAELAEQHLPELRHYQPRATTTEFQRVLLRELDFGRECRHLEQFAANFADDLTVRFPQPYPELSTSRVLTMELLEGVKVAEAEKLADLDLERDELARCGARIYLEMIFRDGFYHADPHPGNLLVLPSGVVGMLDCGMVGRLDERMREDIEEMLMAAVHQDAAHLTSVLMRVGRVPAELDHAALSTDVADLLSYYGGMSLDRLEVGRALTEITDVVRRYHVLLPSSLAMLLKVLIMLEGTSRLLNPRFSLTELIEPYYKKLLWRRLSPERHLRKVRQVLREWESLGEMLPRAVADVLQKVRSGRVHVNLEHKGLEPSVNRLVLGVLTGALFVGSALLWCFRAPPVLADVSLIGAAGCALSMALAVRLAWAIRKSGRLDRRN
jgi:ubiquinone biosynthesis protein